MGGGGEGIWPLTFILFLPRMVLHLGPVLNKPVENFSWLLEADKTMARVSNPQFLLSSSSFIC